MPRRRRRSSKRTSARSIKGTKRSRAAGAESAEKFVVKLERRRSTLEFGSAIDRSLVRSKDDQGQEKVHGPQDTKGPEQPESSGSASNSNEVKAAARGQDHASALEEGKVPAPVPSPTSPVPTDPMDNQR